jgi:peroxiredoxin
MNVRVIVCLCLGWVVWIATPIAPSAGAPPVAFNRLPKHDLVVEPFSDAEVGGLVRGLEDRLARHADPARFAFDFDQFLQNFLDGLQGGVLSRTQEASVSKYLRQLQKRYPSEAETIDKRRRAIARLTIGKPAPDFGGHDLDGEYFRLSDYRGQVVVLVFSGDWCGACRGEYPYHRLLLELYKDRPFALLGVSSDPDPETAKKTKAERGLSYRMWWDGDATKKTEGPIASAWGIGGWPTVYVIDRRGTIRFVNLRQEDLLKGVKQLMLEPAGN